MNTKVLLMSSSLLIAMNCINVGQAMEYWEPKTTELDTNTIELQRKTDELVKQLSFPYISIENKNHICKRFIKIVINWLVDQKGIIDYIKKYSFDTSEEFFAFVLSKICNYNFRLTNDDVWATLIALRSIMIASENNEYYQNTEHVRLVDQFISLIILQDMNNKEEQRMRLEDQKQGLKYFNKFVKK